MFGLHAVKIDIFEDNCILFWKKRKGAHGLSFFVEKTDTIKPMKGKKIAQEKGCFTLPIMERLKHLY